MPTTQKFTEKIGNLPGAVVVLAPNIGFQQFMCWTDCKQHTLLLANLTRVKTSMSPDTDCHQTHRLITTKIKQAELLYELS